MSDYLSYWLPATASNQMERGTHLHHAASNQYGRLAVGDTLWLVTVWPGRGLHLLGPLLVNRLVRQDVAAALLGTDPDGLWDASHHVLSKESAAQPIANISLTDVAAHLRFQSKRDRLDVRDGKVSANQLQSMRRLTPASAALLRDLWERAVARSAASPASEDRHELGTGAARERLYPDEVESDAEYAEGAVRRVSVNAYERDPGARAACLNYHGTACGVCGMEFESVYGIIGRGFIHVHHLKPLALAKAERRVSPRTDLVPVCPNCHAMLHRREPPFSPEDLRRRLSHSAR